LYRRLGGPQDRSGRVRKISPPPGFDPRTVQPVASRYTDWDTRPTLVTKSFMKCKFSTVYRVTEKDFYARPYTAMWHCRSSTSPPHRRYHISGWDFSLTWVGRGGPTIWPPRSPDLTPLEIFAWGLFTTLYTAKESEIWLIWDNVSLKQLSI
jgi:hypothetical protein